MKHLFNHFTPWNLKKRFVYLEVSPLDVEGIGRNIAQKDLMKSIPNSLKKMLGPEKLEILRKTIGARGRKAAEAAIRRLGPKAAEAEARVVARAAFKTAARAEVKIAEKIAQQGVKKAAGQVATKAAQRQAERRVAAEATKRQAGNMLARRGAQSGGQMVLRNTALVVAEEEAALVATTEVAAAGVGVTVAAVAAAVVGVALASWQGYELHKDVSRTGWEGRKDVQERLAKDEKRPWKVENIDSTDKRQGDLPQSVEQKNGHWCRGAALLGRNTATYLMVEAKNFDDGIVDRNISSAKIKQMIDYAEEVKTRIQDLSHKPEIKVGSPVFLEAEASYAALDAAIKAANAALGKPLSAHYTNENMPAYIEAEKAREDARFRNDVVDLDNNVKKLKKIVGEIKGGDKKMAAAILTNLASARTGIKAAENKDQLKPIAKIVKAQQKELDKLILSQKEALAAKEEAARFIRAFVRSKVSPENLKNKKFVEQVMAVCIAQMSINKKGKVAPQVFLTQLNAVFPEASINPDSYALQNDGYFAEDTLPEGSDSPGSKRLEGFLWHNSSRAYVLGLVAKCKKHPAGFESSTGTYTGELKKIMGNKEWQKKATDAWLKGGESAFYAYIISSLPTPGKFFGYDKEEVDNAKAKAEAEKKKPIAKKKKTGGIGRRPARPRQKLANANRKTAEKGGVKFTLVDTEMYKKEVVGNMEKWDFETLVTPPKSVQMETGRKAKKGGQYIAETGEGTYYIVRDDKGGPVKYYKKKK